MVTVINDREGDLYAHWARTPCDKVHLLSRVMHDHAVLQGGTLRRAVERVPHCAKAVLDLPKRIDRPARKAHLRMRFGTVELKRPAKTGVQDLPKSVKLSFVEVIETHPPKGAEPVHWLLLTTHPLASANDAWQVVAWYKQRWIIEQFFRSMKTQGLRIEDSQLETAEGLMKLVAIAAKAAAIVIQLVQARNGTERCRQRWRFPPTKSRCSTPSTGACRARPSCRKTRTPNEPSPGPPGSLPGSADGTNRGKTSWPRDIPQWLGHLRTFFEGWAFKNV